VNESAGNGQDDRHDGDDDEEDAHGSLLLSLGAEFDGSGLFGRLTVSPAQSPGETVDAEQSMSYMSPALYRSLRRSSSTPCLRSSDLT
jgi:hypothetical protein